MKIYTKKGDTGQTSLIGGTRVSKHHLKIESYGTVDELNSHIGLIRDQKINSIHIDRLLIIQDKLFVIGSLLAEDIGKSKMKLPEITNENIEFLEKAIDQMNEELPEMRHFVLPGGHTTVSYCHITRCVCRRAERLVVALSETEKMNKLVLKYLNRLSDYLFVLSRKLSVELNSTETCWYSSI